VKVIAERPPVHAVAVPVRIAWHEHHLIGTADDVADL